MKQPVSYTHLDVYKRQGSGSNGSGSSGSGSSSTGAVKSGVETTIVFVMAGLMVSAAGVMFLARKKKED